jgi:hypothetical protein
MPVEELVRVCHDKGVPVLIDGAHGPLALDVDVTRIAADYYVGNCHKVCTRYITRLHSHIYISTPPYGSIGTCSTFYNQCSKVNT